MGTSAKTIQRLSSLVQRSLLPLEGRILEIGTQELYCTGMDEFVRGSLAWFTDQLPKLRPAADYSDAEIAAFADKGLLGNFLKACGFGYLALDIFEADNTELFDLNLHDPPDHLRGQHDLVTNFGTTEHVLDQRRSFQTMHELVRPGGLIYHDLPMSGYHNHGYFGYNPLLFHHLADANGYEVVLEFYSKGGQTEAPAFMRDNGYPDAAFADCGIEFVLRRLTDAPFRLPLETSTSLDVSQATWGDNNPYAGVGEGNDGDFAAFAKSSLASARGGELQAELLRRYVARVRRLFGGR